MELELEGQVAVIVGAARGLGHAIAAEFLAEGACAAFVDRDPVVEDAVAALDAAVRSRAAAFVADVTEYTSMQRLESDVRRRFGRCDHVIVAAGLGSGKFGFPFWNLEPADWQRVLQVNLMGPVNVAHAFAPAMARAKTGSMLFLASVAGQIGSQTDPPYSASKAGVINFAQCAARDLAPLGVRVNTLCPGMVKTELNRGVYAAWAALQPEAERIPYEQWAEAKIERLVPLRRWQEPRDIAAMAVFLASSRASNITGQTINVDGGYVMHW